jgi:hypothetical protein
MAACAVACLPTSMCFTYRDPHTQVNLAAFRVDTHLVSQGIPSWQACVKKGRFGASIGQRASALLVTHSLCIGRFEFAGQGLQGFGQGAPFAWTHVLFNICSALTLDFLVLLLLPTVSW